MKCTCDIQQLFHGDNGCTCGAIERERSGKFVKREPIVGLDIAGKFKSGMHVRVISKDLKGQIVGEIVTLEHFCDCPDCNNRSDDRKQWAVRRHNNSTYYMAPKIANMNDRDFYFDTAYPRRDETWIKRPCIKCEWSKFWGPIDKLFKLEFVGDEANPSSGYGHAAAHGCFEPVNFGKG